MAHVRRAKHALDEANEMSVADGEWARMKAFQGMTLLDDQKRFCDKSRASALENLDRLAQKHGIDYNQAGPAGGATSNPELDKKREKFEDIYMDCVDALHWALQAFGLAGDPAHFAEVREI